MKAAQPNAPASRIVDDLDMASALEDLGLEMSALDQELESAERTGTGLEALWQVPADLEDRIARGVRQRLRNRQTAWMIADLIGLPFSTARVIIEPDQGSPRA